MDPTEMPESPEFDDTGHPLDPSGQPYHVDIDPVIPTGICRHC